MIVIGGKAYELVREHKDGWKPEAFRERYSEVLDRYDYIVGDWGYNQLRLKGFFRDDNSKAAKDAVISAVHDYLQEYCNFGCAYFILERLPDRNVGGGGPGGADGAEGEPEQGAQQAAGAAESESAVGRSAVDRALEAAGAADGSGEPLPEGMHRIAGVAGGMAFSDRKPYSWREHQSPARGRHSERNDAGGAKDAELGSGAKRDAKVSGVPGGGRGGQRYDRGGGSGNGGGYSQRGSGSGGAERGGQRPNAAGSRKFAKGQRSGGGPDAGYRSGRGGGRGEYSGGPRESRAEGGGAPRQGASGGGSSAGGPNRDRGHHRHQPRPPQKS